MDPHIEPQNTVSSPPAQPEDRADSLRRLNATSGPNPAVPVELLVAEDSPIPDCASRRERRRSPRFLCSGSIELQAEGHDVRMWGKLTDVSLHGCYVEMPTTFPVDTRVILVMESLGVRVRTPATIRVSYPFLGMGICFSDTEPGQQEQLELLLRGLAGQRALLNKPPVEERGLPDIVASADPQIFVEKITDFFRHNGSLSRDQFYQIAKRVRRS